MSANKKSHFLLPSRIMLETHSIRVGKIKYKNFFTYCPGLSYDLVQMVLTKINSTILGHLQQPWKGLRSTQKKKIQ